MDLLEVAFSRQVWEDVINRGVDKTIPKKMLVKYSRPENRVELLDKIISGRYHISPPRVLTVPKDNGGLREIYVNSPEDRLVLAISNQAYNILFSSSISPACKAYQKGLSCGSVVRDVAKQNICGYKLDLSKYFDSVSIDIINAAFDTLDTHSPLDQVIRDYYNTNYVFVNNEITGRFKSLAQGCAVSAFLSNYVLNDIDEQMLNMCEYYCRYSDDMLLLGDNADKALVVLKDMLKVKGLELNPDKVEQINFQTEFKFLGFGICGSTIDISIKDFKAKKREIKQICNKLKKSKLPTDIKLIKVIRSVQDIFFSRVDPFHGWLYSKACTINTLGRICELDCFAKEHIRAAVTGKWNYTTNIHKVTEDMLRDAGYVSLVQMAKLAQIDRDAYQQTHQLYIAQHRGIPGRCVE